MTVIGPRRDDHLHRAAECLYFAWLYLIPMEDAPKLPGAALVAVTKGEEALERWRRSPEGQGQVQPRPGA